MGSSQQGILTVVSGPAGSGKSTVTKLLIASDTSLGLSISYTTRKPRQGEMDGVEYFFTDRTTFEQKLAAGDILEYTEYNGNLYGTPRAEVERILSEGRDIVLEIEVEGAKQIKEKFPDAVTIMLIPPSFRVLESRLRGRNSETEADIQCRLTRAKQEMEMLPGYDYVVVNHDHCEEACVREIQNIIRSEHRKVTRCCEIVHTFFKN